MASPASGAGVVQASGHVRSQHGSAAGCDSRQRALRGGDPRDSFQSNSHEQSFDESSMDKERAVEEINAQIKVLEAYAAKHATTAAKLTKEIAEEAKRKNWWYDW